MVEPAINNESFAADASVDLCRAGWRFGFVFGAVQRDTRLGAAGIGRSLGQSGTQSGRKAPGYHSSLDGGFVFHCLAARGGRTHRTQPIRAIRGTGFPGATTRAAGALSWNPAVADAQRAGMRCGGGAGITGVSDSRNQRGRAFSTGFGASGICSGVFHRTV